MARNKKRKGVTKEAASRRSGRHRGRYNPGKNPMPRHVETVARASNGPTGNSRQQRRKRAVLDFMEQRALAEHMGFPTPPKDAPWEDVQYASPKYAVIGGKTREAWLLSWEERYAAL
jgi:hypothetical protein